MANVVDRVVNGYLQTGDNANYISAQADGTLKPYQADYLGRGQYGKHTPFSSGHVGNTPAHFQLGPYKNFQM